MAHKVEQKMAQKNIRVAIVGASGYGGAELLRLLLAHPYCQTVQLFSSALQSIYAEDKKSWQEGLHYQDYAAMCPAFYGLGLNIYGLPSLELAADQAELCEWQAFYRSFDVVFLATPHAVSVQIVQRYIELSKRDLPKDFKEPKENEPENLAKIIDLSGALRLGEPELYRLWYREETLERGELQQCQYGLSELFPHEIAKAQIVANPGCYATAVILALAPLAKNNLLKRVRIDAKSGVSGAGKKTGDSTHFPQVNESLSLYKLHQHQHTPEIEMALSHCAGSPDSPLQPITLATHLLPITRGIMATCYIELCEFPRFEEGLEAEQAPIKMGKIEMKLHDVYQSFYADAPFVQIRPADSSKSLWLPKIQDVSFSNRCDIGLAWNPRNKELVVVSVIDNLLKGAAGQALQNMNIMFGLDEICGLPLAAAMP